jgi:hypothetical protein
VTASASMWSESSSSRLYAAMICSRSTLWPDDARHRVSAIDLARPGGSSYCLAMYVLLGKTGLFDLVGNLGTKTFVINGFPFAMLLLSKKVCVRVPRRES